MNSHHAGSCNTAKGKECADAAHDAFPAAVESGDPDTCGEVVTRFIKCVGEDCAGHEAVTDLKVQFERGCGDMAQELGKHTKPKGCHEHTARVLGLSRPAHRRQSAVLWGAGDSSECDQDKAHECLEAAHDEFPKTVTAQDQEHCADVVRSTSPKKVELASAACSTLQ